MNAVLRVTFLVMFGFMKKGNVTSSGNPTSPLLAEKDEKERRKKEKKERKDKVKKDKGSVSGGTSAEDLLRLDEVRRSLKLSRRRKDKEKLPSGITADYSANFFGGIDRENLMGQEEMTETNATVTAENDASKTVNTGDAPRMYKGLPLPPLPPRPPKRGALRQNERHSIAAGVDEYDSSGYLRNTVRSELLSYQNILAGTALLNNPIEAMSSSNCSVVEHYNAATIPTVCISSSSSPDKQSCDSPSVESLTDSTTNSSFATPPFSSSPVGEGQGFYPRFSDFVSSNIFQDAASSFNEFPLPDVENAPLPHSREIAISRKSARNDFGFSLRRAMTVERFASGVYRSTSVILVEPTDGHQQETVFLPGDRLIEVNGIPINEKTREEITEMIKSSDSSVTIKVQPLSELSELSTRYRMDGTVVELDSANIKCNTLKRSGSKRFKHTNGKSDEQLENEKRWLDSEKYWLMHKGGFTAVRLMGRNEDSGKVKVRLEATNEEAELDDDDVEIANPEQLDRCEDLSQLRYLNECSVLHTLRQRFASNLIHTYAGPTMVVINPVAPLSLYSDKVARMFRGCKTEDMPAHIYSVAQSAYRELLTTRRDQSIVLLGRSGSGKTFNYRHILQYLVITASSANKCLNVEKLNAIWTVLESFGNAKTALNHNATRFTHFFNLDFDHAGQITSAFLQILSYEKWRIVKKPMGECTFHIMHRFLAGIDGTLRKELLLDQVVQSDQYKFFIPFAKQHDEKQRALIEFGRLCVSFKVLEFSESETKVVFSVLAAIVHLMQAAASSRGGKWQFAEPVAAQRAAKCLGTTMEELARSIFYTNNSFTPTNSVQLSKFTAQNSSTSPSPTSESSLKIPSCSEHLSGAEALEGFVVGLYSELFAFVCSLINRNISNTAKAGNSLLLIDYPGFQNPASSGQRQDGATFNDLCDNYLHERLQLLFHQVNVDAPRDRYNQEGVEVNFEDDEDASHTAAVVDLLDNCPLGFLRSSQLDLRQSSIASDARSTPGLFSLLDDMSSSFQSVVATDQSFLDKTFSLHAEKDGEVLIRKVPGNNNFVIQHCQGTNPVLYHVDGWIKNCQENPVSKMAIVILQESTNKDISSAFSANRTSASGCSTVSGSVCSLDGTHSLRRVSSIRRTFTAAFKKKSVSMQCKFCVDGVIETLRRTKVKFVHCFMPHHDSGLSEKHGPIAGGNIVSNNVLINVPLLRSQLRGSDILPVVRAYKQGFPVSILISEFCRRFGILGKDAEASDEKRKVENILVDGDVDSLSYRIGFSQVFLRPNVVTRLESQRDEKLAGLVTGLQARCRGHLARRHLAKLKVEDLAVRCIQKNVRKLMLVRDWSWWRLLVRITPLLNVHRTEQELKSRTDELETLRTQYRKLEQERNLLKQENLKLDAKLSEATADLAEEHSTATLTSERLELETAEKSRLENELRRVQDENKKLQETGERLEMELLCMKNADVSSTTGSIEEDDPTTLANESVGSNSSGSGGVYKRRYERVARELEFTKRRLQQQHHDDLEQLIGLRKQLEKKLSDAYEEVEEQRQVVAQWKRKLQKVTAEMNDQRLLLEESNARNNLLEKKQRKFDTELQLLQEELRQERQAKEKAMREKDIAVGEKYTLEQNVSALKLDVELKDQKINSMNRELQDVTYGGAAEEEIAKLRKAKHDLENKVTELEEELDDLAGQVQLLEQAKLRLEMTMEQQRKEHKKEISQRDDEADDIRCNTTKKVKALESQLENEHEERTLLLRERHELERRLADSEERQRSGRSVDQETINKLKRDLKKTRVLLQDAQMMMQRAKSDAPNKAILRQLRNQIEDAECAKNAAVKARQLLESELVEANANLEEAQRARSDAEERAALYAREKAQLQSQVDENEEELAEVLKKYRSTVQQLSGEQLTLHEQASRIAELESERASLKEQVAEITSRLENIETHGDSSSSLAVKRLELKTKELESKLELEQTTKSRMEVQISRLKEATEKLQQDANMARCKEAAAQETVRKLQRSLREAREMQATYESKEAAEASRRRELEKRLEQTEMELASAKADLKLALHRVDDLQSAIQGDLDEHEDDAHSDSDNDSGDSDNSFQSYLTQNNGRVSVDHWLNGGAKNGRLDGALK